MKRVAAGVVIALALGACTGGEVPLSGRQSCWDLEDGEQFGGGREIPESDIKLFGRPGAYTAAETAAVLEPLGVPVDSEHVMRVRGPCGEQDVFVRYLDGEHCITVVALRWWDRVCRSALDGPTELPLDLGEVEGHAVLYVDGGDIATVLAESGDLVLGAIPIGGHTIVASPQPVGPPTRIPFDTP